MINSLTGRGSAKVWIPSRSSEIESVIRREKLVTAVSLGGMIALIVAGLDTQYMMDKLPLLVATIPLVFLISFFAILLACLFAALAALGLLSGRPICYVSARSYVSLFQGVPLVVVLFLLYFGLPQLNSALILTPVQGGVLGLALSNAAYMAEVFRSSILAVPKGQGEAARAIGMSEAQTMWRIILPQAARIAIPPTANYYIFILKDSALVGLIGVSELFSTARSIGQRDFQVLEMLVLAGAIYWITTMGLSSVQSRLEQRIGSAYARDT